MSVLTYTILFGVAVAATILAFLLGIGSRQPTGDREEERMYFASMAPTLEDVELAVPFRQRVLSPALSTVLQYLGRLAPQHNIQETQRRLEVAGRPYGWGVLDFLGLRLLSAIVFGGLIFVLTLFGDLTLLRRLLLMAASVAARSIGMLKVMEIGRVGGTNRAPLGGETMTNSGFCVSNCQE